MRFLLTGIIRFYQRFLSKPLHALGGPGMGCRFHPTCSQYFLEAVLHHGAWRGSLLGIRRLLSCHPWGRSGYDPVPGTEKEPDPAGSCDKHSQDSSSPSA
jgi:uncharacterized protein